MDELTEVKQMLEQLAAVADRLTRSDRRFLESWQAYLARTGDAAKIGPCRLANLRKVWSGYFANAAEIAPGVAPLAASASGRAGAGNRVVCGLE